MRQVLPQHRHGEVQKVWRGTCEEAAGENPISTWSALRVFFWSVSLDLYTYIYIHTWVWEQSNWWNYADITGCNTAPHACGDLCSHQQPQIVTAKDIDQICNGHFIQDIKGYIQSCTFNEQVCDGSVFMESYHSFTIAYIRFVSCHGEEHPSNCAFSHALSMSEGAECLRALKVAQHSQPI